MHRHRPRLRTTTDRVPTRSESTATRYFLHWRSRLSLPYANVVEDWDVLRLRVNMAVIGMPGYDPFLFQFDRYKPSCNRPTFVDTVGQRKRRAQILRLAREVPIATPIISKLRTTASWIIREAIKASLSIRVYSSIGVILSRIWVRYRPSSCIMVQGGATLPEPQPLTRSG